MASCSLCVSHDIIEPRNVQLDQAEEIYLPYYREITNYLPSPQSEANYTYYHLFCLRKNITPFICSIDKAYEVGFSSRETGDAMVMVMDIYKGGEKVILTDDILNFISSNINKFIDLYPYCLVYDISFESYPKDWLRAVLPEIECGRYQSGSIFCNFEGAADYNSRWDKSYEKINNVLCEWFKNGIISLEGVANKQDFIKKWNLVPISKRLYTPDWEFKFTRNGVDFLLNQIKGDNRLMLFIGKNDLIKTREGWLIKEVNNYKEVESIIISLLIG